MGPPKKTLSQFRGRVFRTNASDADNKEKHCLMDTKQPIFVSRRTWFPLRDIFEIPAPKVKLRMMVIGPSFISGVGV